ncbi:amidohydrolase [Rhizobium sp. CRIBSB]|nr:amidohydrolase [Rhizobium sp. CRIBSB]
MRAGGGGNTDSGAPLTEGDRARIVDHVAAYAPTMNALAQSMWLNPELGYQETKASASLAQALREQGFGLRTGVAEIPTAFIATYGAGEGPVIAFLAEMDALPGFSQAAAPNRQSVEGLTKGHACGHNLFGAGSLGAAVALMRWMRENGIAAEVRVYGTPAEEGGAGKAYMARAGLFDDVDVALHWHPGDSNTVWQNHSLASMGAKFRFRGKSAHAASSPETGRSALHAVEAFHHMAGMMREVVPLHTHIHYVVTRGGDAPNTIPDFAESYLSVRHPQASVVREVFARVVQAAEGAALGTGTHVEFEQIGGIHPLLPNDTLGRLTYQNLLAAPPIRWNDDELQFARVLQETLDQKPDLASVSQVGGYYHGQIGAFSTDVGDISWLAPCAALGTATWVPGTKPHTWQAVAAGGMSIGEKGMKLAAIVLATTAASLLRSPAILESARSEFLRSRGPTFTYQPLIAAGGAPLQYRDEPTRRTR